MNVRECFKSILRFEKPDFQPLFEFLYFWEDAIDRWYKEGLPVAPKKVDITGFLSEWDKKTREYSWSALWYFGINDWEFVPIDFYTPIPSFTPKILEETDRYVIIRGQTGNVHKTFKLGMSVPQSIDFPVKTREDFEMMKTRYDPKDIRRYPKNWDDEGFVEYYEMAKHPILLRLDGFFAQVRSFMGLETFMKNFYTDPNLIQDIMNFWADYQIELYEPVLRKVKVDFAYIWEDMAYRHGPMISPKFFQKFMLPCYKKLTNFLKGKGVDLIGVDSDGNIEALIPLWLEGGVNVLFPLEAAAGMDVVALRDEYGKRLALIGNIDKRALIGGKESIKKEVDYKLSIIEEGGYIPSIDHAVPSNVSFQNYSYYINLLKKRLDTN